MSRQMEKVVRFKCKWCGKEFKTPDRHQCKFDPDAHNCLSCVFRGNCEDAHREGECDYFPPSFWCAIHGEPKQGGLNDFPEAVSPTIGGECKCREWKMIEGWKGKRTFKERMDCRQGFGDSASTKKWGRANDVGFLPDAIREAANVEDSYVKREAMV